MNGHIFVDLRNVYDGAQMASLGFSYSRLGQGDFDSTTGIQVAA
jgi:hypothetical protein